MAEMAQDSFFWQKSLKQLSTSPKNLNAMGAEEYQRFLTFVALKHRQMNRVFCSGTKRTFFMEMENKSRFFLNIGDGKNCWFRPAISGKMPNYVCDGVARFSSGLKKSEAMMTEKTQMCCGFSEICWIHR